MIAKIKIKDLSLKTYIGFNPEELINQQKVVINVEIETDISADVLKQDEPVNILDYKVITKKIISFVSKGRFKLLEVLARKILDLLMEDEKIIFARIEVDKPGALRYARSVSVVMEERRHFKYNYSSEKNGPIAGKHSTGGDLNLAIIGIGSNIDPDKNIPAMLSILENSMNVIKLSSLVKTKPIGIADQPDFTNGVIKVETSMKQEELRDFLKNIEDRLGRDRTSPPFGPRTIDLDIVIWNGDIVDDDYYSRDFLRDSIREVS